MVAAKEEVERLFGENQYEQGARVIKNCPRLLQWFLTKSTDMIDKWVSEGNTHLAMDFVDRTMGEIPAEAREILTKEFSESVAANMEKFDESF